MATSPSLFGATPESIQQQQAAALDAQAMQYAKMDPFQRATYGIYKGANQLGGAIGGMLGGQDPQMVLLQKRQEMLQGLDQTDPQSWIQLARKLQGANDYAGAQEAAGKAQALQLQTATINKANAESIAKLSEKNTPEVRNAIAAADADGFARDTPAWKASFKAKFKEITTPAGNRDQIKEVGVAVATGKPVYTLQTPAGIQQITFEVDPVTGEQTPTPYTGPVDRTTAKTTVTATASTKGAVAGAEQIAKLDAQRLSDASLSSDKALNAAGLLQTLQNTPQPISGTGSGARVATLRVFDTLGMTSAKDRVALQSADTFNSLAGERVISFIKELGSNPTDTDREFARTIGPALEKGTKTNQDLITYLLGRAKDTTGAATAMENHFYANNYSLQGFKSPLMKNLQAVTPASLTDAQLAAEIARLKRGTK